MANRASAAAEIEVHVMVDPDRRRMRRLRTGAATNVRDSSRKTSNRQSIT
jgi:hypothetical protein